MFGEFLGYKRDLISWACISNLPVYTFPLYLVKNVTETHPYFKQASKHKLYPGFPVNHTSTCSKYIWEIREGHLKYTGNLVCWVEV